MSGWLRCGLATLANEKNTVGVSIIIIVHITIIRVIVIVFRIVSIIIVIMTIIMIVVTLFEASRFPM